WGSRGDIKLGVPVTYADINNCAVLMEIARKKGNYVPQLSFGTHFFLDLVEAEIRYIPLYPDEPECVLNEAFLRRARNMLPEMLPEHAHLADTLRVIDVVREREGRVLRVLMNADLDEAVGLFDIPRRALDKDGVSQPADTLVEQPSEAHWRWRMTVAERLAEELEMERFGVRAIYIFGSVKNATAGPSSDIDLLVHLDGRDPERDELTLWLDGWSRALAEINFLRTGYRSDELLDVHYITDEDIEKQSSFASKIGAVTDPARPLRIRNDSASG
ncbi:MAG: nucleotidyltransferase domain-containing protein, partial [Acidobacteriota bacterium]